MSVAEPHPVCSGLIEKVSSGQRLDAAERGHLMACDTCQAALVEHLDKTAEPEPPQPFPVAEVGLNGVARGSAKAEHALEEGRKVFAREFGLSLTGEQHLAKQSPRQSE